jgi:Protein of unknown function (DUF3261)
MNIPSRCAIALLPLVLGGCVAGTPIFGSEPKNNQAILARGLTCEIPAPGVAGENISAAQTLTMTHGGKVYTFDAQIQMTSTRTDLVALDGLGRRAMTISWHNGEIESSRASWVPALVRPADVLATLMIVYLARDIVAPALSACGAKLSESGGGRVVSFRGKDVIVVRYGPGDGWTREAHLHNTSLDLHIDIKSVELAP